MGHRNMWILRHSQYGIKPWRISDDPSTTKMAAAIARHSWASCVSGRQVPTVQQDTQQRTTFNMIRYEL